MRKRIIIYSAGGMAEKVTYSLDFDKFEILAYIDKNAEFHGKRYLGNKPIIFPEEVSRFDYDYIINAVSMFDEDVRNTLASFVSQDKIITFLPNTNDIIWADERWIMARKCAQMINEQCIPGEVAEVGVYKGEFARILNHCFPDRLLHLFDTFEGFVETKDTLDSREDNVRFKDTSVDKVLDCMPHKEKCIIHKGWFPGTAKDVKDVFCFVSLDCDLYEPTKAGLEYFFPILQRGGICLCMILDIIIMLALEKLFMSFWRRSILQQ